MPLQIRGNLDRLRLQHDFPADNPVTPTAPTLPNPLPAGDNILEPEPHHRGAWLFRRASAARPTRGSNAQGDIFLNGVPYLQTITHITSPDQSPVIHVEPGIWMAVPPTTAPSKKTTGTRMGSIRTAPQIPKPRGPRRTSTDARTSPSSPSMSFCIGGSQPPFPSGKVSQPETAADVKTARLPRILSTYMAEALITQDILDDPNLLLRNHISNQKIVATTEIKVSTQPGQPNLGPPAPRPPRPCPPTRSLAAAPTTSPFSWATTSNRGPPSRMPTPSRWRRPSGSRRSRSPFTFRSSSSVSEPFVLSGPNRPFPAIGCRRSSCRRPTRSGSGLRSTFLTTQIQYSQVVMLNFSSAESAARFGGRPSCRPNPSSFLRACGFEARPAPRGLRTGRANRKSPQALLPTAYPKTGSAPGSSATPSRSRLNANATAGSLHPRPRLEGHFHAAVRVGASPRPRSPAPCVRPPLPIARSPCPCPAAAAG